MLAYFFYVLFYNDWCITLIKLFLVSNNYIRKIFLLPIDGVKDKYFFVFPSYSSIQRLIASSFPLVICWSNLFISLQKSFILLLLPSSVRFILNNETFLNVRRQEIYSFQTKYHMLVMPRRGWFGYSFFLSWISLEGTICLIDLG